MFKTVKTVATHSLIYGLGDLLTKLVGFVLIPFYTHYLTAENYGVLELLDLTSYVVSLILAMGICQALVRFYFEFEEHDKRDQVIGNALITVWFASVIGAVVLVYFSTDLSELVLQSSSYYQLFNVMFLSTVLGLCNEIPLNWLRIRQQSVLFTAVSLVRVSISLTLNIVLIVYFKLGVMGILLSGLISSAVVGVFLLYYMLKRVKLSFSASLLKRMFAFGLPLIASWFGSFILNFCDRFLLQRMASLGEVGVYALGYKFGFLLNVLLLSPFQRTWAPKQFEIAKESNAPQTFSLVFTYYCFLQFFLTLGISAVIKDVIILITSPEYYNAYRYVPLILLAYNFNGAYTFFQFGLLYQKRTKIFAAATLAAAVLNIAVNFLLIPSLGAWGAAWATFISFAFLFVLIFSLAQRAYYVPLEVDRLAKLIVAAVVLYVVASFANPANLGLSLAVKAIIASLYPLLLIPLGFYRTEEIGKLKELRERFLGAGWLKREAV